ncbi:acidic repeat-containing protein isoform X2 [Drosophila santomea]|uniref:acidic repeat-containing protein isoform X2 n=1 Tax=Drosophila santomea TaxID=129105 RepID=UPI0019537011|nr:acidic repeat-containing protein isoform X2 [Drosophila santomea]
MAFENSAHQLKIPDEGLDNQWIDKDAPAPQSQVPIAPKQMPDTASDSGSVIWISSDSLASSQGEAQGVNATKELADFETLYCRKLRARGPGSIKGHIKTPKLAKKRCWPDGEDDKPDAKKSLAFEQFVSIYDRENRSPPEIENNQSRRQNYENDFASAMSAEPCANPEDSLVNLINDCNLEENGDAQTPQSQAQMEPHHSASFASADSDIGSHILESDDSHASACSYLHSSEICNSSDFEELRKAFTKDSSYFELSLDSDSRSPSSVHTDKEMPKLAVKRHSPGNNGDGLVKKKSYRNLDEMPTPSNRPVVTRSGRVVVSRPNQQFDYSSSQSKGDGEEDSEDLSLDSDDEDYQGKDFEQPKWTGRKRRSFRSSSISASSTDGSHSSPEAVPRLVYLELGDKVVKVRDEPQSNVVLEDDGELKTKMHKFLGLIASRRKLYYPAQDCDMDPEDNNEKNVSLSIIHVANTSPTSAPTPPTPSAKLPIRPDTTPTSTSTWSKLNLSHIHSPTTAERQAKVRDDFVLQAIVYSFEECTPDSLKEPIDLSELPSKKQLATNCRRHKSSVACLERHRHFYGFVQSLSPAISLNMCHPLALTYRQTDFCQCKVPLAKTLFNMFNHAIFHCGLQVPIVWKQSMNTRWKCVLTIDASGKRTAEILLLRSIETAAELIQPLLHEMCHAAAFLFNRELGHGDNCRRWAYQAKMAFPEVPTINDCMGSFKYTCTMCTRCSYGVVDLQTHNLRCYYCQFELSVKPFCKTNMHDGARSDPTMTPFKCFIRDKYLKLGEEGGATHSSRMTLLNEEFVKMHAKT